MKTKAITGKILSQDVKPWMSFTNYDETFFMQRNVNNCRFAECYGFSTLANT